LRVCGSAVLGDFERGREAEPPAPKKKFCKSKYFSPFPQNPILIDESLQRQAGNLFDIKTKNRIASLLQ
jgi:hypothetical protein